MDSPVTQFFNALNAKEAALKPTLAADNLGVILKAAISELDWFYYNLRRRDIDFEPEEEDFEGEERFYILKLGVTRLIQLALEARPSFDAPVVTFCRIPEHSKRVLELVCALGMIEHGRRVAQLAQAGLCEVSAVTETEFVITLPSILADDSHYERAVVDHYRAQHRERILTGFALGGINDSKDEVMNKLAELVYPFQQHFIGYDATPILDDYFFAHAYAHVETLTGFDTFHYKTKFGGVFYQHYILALTFLISIYTKHEHFAEALIRKEPSIKLENVLTISSDTQGFLESLRESINYFGSVFDDFEEVSDAQCQTIFEVLSCSRKNAQLLTRPASPVPLIIQSSDASFIRCLTGASTDPMQFLLDSLRLHFPRDYDRNQQTREKSMQAAIKRVLNADIPGLRYLENVKLRVEGRQLTDIDLVILDDCTGVVLLVQQKYQELYGADIHAMHSRSKRLNEQSDGWLKAVEQWLGRVPDAEVRACFQVPKGTPSLSVQKFILAQHYGHSLKKLVGENTFLYSTWVQLFNCIQVVKKALGESADLRELIAELGRMQDKIHSTPQEHLPEPKTTWNVGNLKFTTVQEASLAGEA